MNSRPSWNETFMNICEEIRKRSTCARIQTSAIIVKNTNIISIGYNGVPSGKIHCISIWGDRVNDENFYDLHHAWSGENELHAEMNAILQSETSLKGCNLFTLYSPCTQCAKCIIASGITKVFYKFEYSRDTKGLGLLAVCGIEVVHIV